MDQHDEESIPRLPEDGEYESSAIEERPPFFSRRRKAIAAAVASVAVACAVAVGVALPIERGAHSPVQNDVAQSTPIANAADAEPSVLADQERPDDEYDEPTSDETPQEEEVPSEEVPAGADDANANADAADGEDEELDIIIDVGYEQEHPEDVILDSGFAQREPEVQLILPASVDAAEKVEYISEDFALETAVFEGPVTDFIVTPYMSRITVTTSSTCPNANEGLWKMTLETDNYPWETYWELLNWNNDVVAFGPPKRRNYARSTKYIGQMCFKAGQYKLRLGDKNSDGLCCKYGRGGIVVQVNGETVAAQRGNQSFKEKVFTFPIRGGGGGGNNPTPSTPQPTPKPTPKPTPQPTMDVNPSPQCKNVDIKVVTDRFGGETSYKFTPDNNPKKILLEKKPGSMLGKTTYKDTACVQDGKYRLTVTDPFQGIQEGGYYSVTVDGEEVMYGNVFQGGEQVHVIRVGYNPPMSARDREWLNAHNVRRREYFQKEGLRDKPLVWSPQLAEEASNWVDEILPMCKVKRQPSLREGENISVRTAGGIRDEGPIPILTRWTENKKDMGYPRNQSMTQVLWRGSRYVGCSEKSWQRPNGTWCYVSLCRYARAGNCSMQKYNNDWRKATLVDRTRCGPICPENGNECY